MGSSSINLWANPRSTVPSICVGESKAQEYTEVVLNKFIVPVNADLSMDPNLI